MTFAQKINEAQITMITELIKAAGGKIVGRTRLQKMVYLLESAGFLSGFDFEYKHYGPYSDDVAHAAYYGQLDGTISEEEQPASWGGRYSVYRALGSAPKVERSMQKFIDIAVSANAVALELAATAVYVATNENIDNVDQAWIRTAQLKPEKTGYLDQAKALYADLRQIPSRTSLPAI